MPDPAILPENDTENLRPAERLSRVQKTVESSDFYKGLSSQEKIGVHKQIYKKYVVPANAQMGTDISFFDYVKGRAGHKNDPIKKTKTAEGFAAEEERRKNPEAAKAAGAVTHGVLTSVKAGYGAYQHLHDAFDSAVISGINLVNRQYTGQDTTLKPDTPKSQLLEKVFDQDKKWMDDHYNGGLRDRAIAGGGELVGQIPAFMAADGVLAGAKLLDLTKEGVELAPKLAPAARILHNAANGYLVGKFTNSDSPTGDAAAFAAIPEIMRPAGRFLGKLLGLGGMSLVKESVAAGIEAVETKAPETQVSNAMVAAAGNPKQRVSAAVVKTLNDLVGGDWGKASPAQKRAAVAKLGKIAPELSDQLAVVNGPVIKAQASAQIDAQRKASPLFNDLLTTLEKHDPTPTADTVKDYVVDKAKNKVGASSSQLQQFLGSGAAHINSLEFEDNLSKTVGDFLKKAKVPPVTWEDRGHKLLFAWNVLISDPHVGTKKDRELMFSFLWDHLQKRYPGKTMGDFARMSDMVWNKLQSLSEQGFTKEGEPTRFFRQSNVDPKLSPFSHEVELLKRADKTATGEEQFVHLDRSGKVTSVSASPQSAGEKEAVVAMKPDGSYRIHSGSSDLMNKNVDKLKRLITLKKSKLAKGMN